MARDYCFIGWQDDDNVYHIRTIRRRGEQLVVSRYASLDPKELGYDDSHVRDLEPTEADLERVAALLIRSQADCNKITLDGITVTERRTWSKERGMYLLKFRFTNDDGSDTTVEQLRKLVLRHLDDAIASIAVEATL